MLRTEMYLGAIEREAKAFLASAHKGLGPSVPSCPEWSVGDLVRHLSDVYEFWCRMAQANGPSDFETTMSALRAEREERTHDPQFMSETYTLPRFEECNRMLVDALRGRDPNDPAWTWFPSQQTIGFIQRRMAHETAIHRWDIQSAFHQQQDIEPNLARDGISEIFEVFVPDAIAESGAAGTGHTYHFHQTDGDGEWFIEFDSDRLSVRPVHAHGDVACRGKASDIDLFLWRRVPKETLDIHGDLSLVDPYFDLVPPIT